MLMSELVAPAHGQRGDSRRPIKLNLYRDYEVDAVAKAMADSPVLQMGIRLDCLMVSDSYLMTHLGRDSTRLAKGEQALFLEIGTVWKLMVPDDDGAKPTQRLWIPGMPS